MREYDKIPTIYARNPKTKKLIEELYANDELKYLHDNLWTMTEKVDGTNIRVYWDGHSVFFGGRTDKAQIPLPLLAKLEELFGGEENEGLFEQKFGEMPVELFGEGYGPGIQKGGLYTSSVNFILFDVMASDNYQPRSSVEDIADYFGLSVVPVIFVGTLEEGVRFVKTHPVSAVCDKQGEKDTCYMEGLVARPLYELQDRCGKRIITKIKYCDFLPEGNPKK